MKLTADQYELIEAYLNGQLAPADRADLELDFQANPELAREVDLQRELRVGFKALGLEARLQAAQQRYKARTAPSEPAKAKIRTLPTEPARRLNWGGSDYRTWAAAASVVLVIGIMIWGIWPGDNGQFTKTAYAQNYQPDPADFVARDLPANLKPADRVTVERGMALYNQGNYADAIGTLKVVVDADSSLAIASYYLGISYLTTPDVDKAIRYLRVAERSSQPAIRQKAQWYLALAYLKKNDRPRTQRSLQVVADDTRSPYRSRAEALIKQLSGSNG